MEWKAASMLALGASATVAVIVFGCGTLEATSNPTEPDATPDAPTTDDAHVPPGTDGGGDAGPFCDRHPDATVCDDFPSDVLDGRWEHDADGGSYSLVEGGASPPRSLLLVAPVPGSTSDRCTRDLAYVRRPLNVTVAKVMFGASYSVDFSAGHASVGGLQVQLKNGADRCTLYTRWSSGIPKIAVDTFLAGVATSDAASFALTTAAVEPNTWVRIDLRLEVDTITGTRVFASIDGGAFADVGVFPTCVLTNLTLFQAEANCNDVSAPKPFAIHVDDVLLELE